MKLFIVLLCLLLCGCSAEAAQQEPIQTMPPVTEPVLLQETDHPFAQDGLSVFSLLTEEVQGLQTMGNNLLVFSGCETTTLTLLDGKDLCIISSITLDFPLSPDDPSLNLRGDGFSCFDPVSRKTLIFNELLKQTGSINAPRGLLGSPILLDDQSLLFYCTADGIRVWEQASSIHRTLKQLSCSSQQLTGLHMDGSVLQCQIEDEGDSYTLFLSAETGRQLAKWDGTPNMMTQKGRYYAVLPIGSLKVLVFGDPGKTPQILYPRDLNAAQFILPKEQAAVTASISDSGEMTLDCYCLNTGARKASLSLPVSQTPKAIVSLDGAVHLLISDVEADCWLLCRWELPSSQTNDNHVYISRYIPEGEMDGDALAQCTAYAEALSKKYGIHIRIGKDAAAVQPWDYHFEPETLIRVTMEELALLDARLGAYPQEMLHATASPFDSLNLCLVRQISGSTSAAGLNNATGIQFLQDGNAYVVLAVGKYAGQALYHELFHVMETHIMNESTAFDHWDALNPAGFSYDYDYQTNQTRNSGVYLETEHRAFVDSYSMSFPKEDRARIMEYAMLPGQQHMFQSQIMQNKLRTLCDGIREAYDLADSLGPYLWEQYLQ